MSFLFYERCEQQTLPRKADIWLEVTSTWLFFLGGGRLVQAGLAEVPELQNLRISKRNPGPGTSWGHVGLPCPPPPFFFRPEERAPPSQHSASCSPGTQAWAHLGWQRRPRQAAAAHLPRPSPTWCPRVGTLSSSVAGLEGRATPAVRTRQALALPKRPTPRSSLPPAARWAAPAARGGLAASPSRDLPETLPPSGCPEFHGTPAIRPTDRCELFPWLVGLTRVQRSLPADAGAR